jgi:opacity protein-like surface antigen
MDVDGEKYTIETTYRPQDGYATLQPGRSIAPGPNEESTPADQHKWDAPSVELGIHGAWMGYFGGNGGAIGYLFTDANPPEMAVFMVLDNSLHNGWSIGGSVTLNPWKYLSNEFSFEHSYTKFNLGLGVIAADSTSPSVEEQTAFNESGLRTSQVAYNLLINLRPKSSRLRPYFAVGPSLQLMHLADAPIKQAPGWFRLGLGNIGLIGAAYDFGGTPPLEGGGIFQAGLNYGGGVRYRVTPRWMIRADYRETLVSQPDFWTKSEKDILSGITVDEGSTLTVIGPVFDAPLRQDRVSAGVSFTF